MSEHWYTPMGASAHEIIGKSTGRPRPTNIKDARELGLLPSVTTVLGVVAKPELDKWKQEQITKAAHKHLSSGPVVAEWEVYHGKIIEAAFQQVDDAADLGTRIHKALENALQGLEWDRTLAVYVDATVKRLKADGIVLHAHEVRLASTLFGYAGMTDGAYTRENRRGILDFKTRKTKPEYAEVKPYSGQPTQIAAYHRAHYGPIIQDGSEGCNVFISTTEPGRVEICYYNGTKLTQEFEVFQHILAVWRHLKGYDPRRN